MKFSEKWLRQWVNPQLDTAQLCEQLTMAGLEVDSVTPVAGNFAGVVVGQIVACEKHPDADKLNVCDVDVGEKSPVTVVCGGSNVRVDLKIALATVGAVLPGNFKIKKSKLRGVVSNGMICSAGELEMEDPNATPKGIMELDPDMQLGMDVREALSLDDNVIDIELTPNRGDCANIKGIAYEVGVLNQLPLTEPDLITPKESIKDTHTVNVKAPSVCPRYVGRVIKGINTTAQTPIWMTALLTRAGIRCIHPVVDVCNYVMLELGQPMHGFDLDKLNGDITVRMAKKDEQLKLLDEQTATLSTLDLVISDEKSVLAVAGVMGGFDSGVTAQTQHVFLEAAFFDPVATSLTARRLGLSTDSSYRFERGVDYTLQQIAMERATQLILDIAGGMAGPITEACDQEVLPVQPNISLRRAEIFRLLGIEFKDRDVVRMLTALGMDVQTDGKGWVVTPPSRRFDIAIEVDLIEELARIYGYNNIPDSHIQGSLALNQSKKNVPLERLADLLVDRGYHEAITYSFVDDKLQQSISPSLSSVSIDNPISSDMSVMRTSIWPGLLSVMLYNQNRQVTRQRIFETGLCFYREGKEIIQEAYLSLLIAGDIYPEQWGQQNRRVDFYDLKGDVMALLNLSGHASIRWEAGTHSALHPGQSADLYIGESMIGYLGVLHPSLVKSLGLRQPPVLFEAKLSVFNEYRLPQYAALSKFPAVRRDLALVIDEQVAVREILQAIRALSDNILHDVQVFDIYQGEGIEKSKKSIALGLTFQDPSRTLVELDINSVIQNIIKGLKDEFNATLRT